MYTFTGNVSLYHMYFSFTVHYSYTENKYFHVRFIGKNHIRQFYLLIFLLYVRICEL